MSDKKAEGAKPEGEAKAAAGDASHGGSGGLKAWMPLLVTIVLMPALAFTTTKFLILPKVVQARGGGETAAHEAGSGESGHEAIKDPGDHGKGKEGKGAGKKKQAVPITKVIVNVAGSMGARYLMVSFTLVGTHTDFKTIIEENKDQLLD